MSESMDIVTHNDTDSGREMMSSPINKWIELKKINTAMQLVLLAKQKAKGEQPFDDLNNFIHEANKHIK